MDNPYLYGGCNGCSSTPMTAMQINNSLKKLEAINDVIFVNGELPEYIHTFIDQKMAKEAVEGLSNENGVQSQQGSQYQQNGHSEQSSEEEQEPGEIV